ncbi:arginine--tRNA ligase [Patescibacteria group bacterium]|nr:arginine--tRNA ligase [Patescibacteria group bacterium]
MKHAISFLLQSVLTDLGVPDVVPEVEISDDPKHGDYTTNIALRLSKQLKKSPMDIALQVSTNLKSQISTTKPGHQGLNRSNQDQKISQQKTVSLLLQDIDHIDVVPPGFINIFFTEAALSRTIVRVIKDGEAYGTRSFVDTQDKQVKKKKIMVEYAHPNTHKSFHIGHLRNITTAESLIRLLEAWGSQVIRVNYEGDVGMHIAKALYGLMQIPSFKSQIPTIRTKTVKEKVEFLGKAYAAGSTAFEEDPKAKEQIVDYNALIYASAQRFAREKGIEAGSFDYISLVKGNKDAVGTIYDLWKETRQWSLDYFETIYKRVGSHFDRYYFESECLAGVDSAREAVKKKVLMESEGAIIFYGKPYGLDTRVFVNSLGLPTYEAKELALAPAEFTEFGHLDKLIHVVGPEQASFFKVTFKVEELLGIQKDQQQHYIYGWVKLKHGKMSSRTGQVVLGEWLLDEAKKEIYTILQKSNSNYTKEEQDMIADKAAVAAVKYSFLKVSPQSEIAFDLGESVSFEGDSGPYLQYTYARARSVLRKSQIPMTKSQEIHYDRVFLNPEERAIARLLVFYPDVVADAAKTLSPSTICTYLFSLGQAYNLFYAKHSILRDTGKASTYQGVRVSKKNSDTMTPSDTMTLRLLLTAATAQVLKNGLYLLGIETLEQM